MIPVVKCVSLAVSHDEGFWFNDFEILHHPANKKDKTDPAMTDKPYMMEGQFLIAMPNMSDPRFHRSLIYLCAHSEESGAMGIVINKEMGHVDFHELIDHLGLNTHEIIYTPPIHFGGPVSSERGFVLHTSDYAKEDSTLNMKNGIGLTATLDILKAIAKGEGPHNALLALGYAGWAPGQLENEILNNGWLHCDADENLLFSSDNESKWSKALANMGINPAHLSGTSGRA